MTPRVCMLAALVLTWPTCGAGYGPIGHLIAGTAAEPLLCPAAAQRVAALGDGLSLGELGLWADRIRGNERFADAAPWHYVDADDESGLRRRAPAGDVLWAIEHFAGVLQRGPTAEQANALRFLVHFIVDLHQPLHVGRAEDRGGNDVEVRYAGVATSLHAFWDTTAIEHRGLGMRRYARRIGPEVGSAFEREVLTPFDWARESLALREVVYAFDAQTGELSDVYLQRAEAVTEQRLVLAAARLAATLNRIFCN